MAASAAASGDDWTVVGRSGKGGKKGGISLSKASRLAAKAQGSSLAECDCRESSEELQKRTDALSKALDRALDDVRAAPFLPGLQAALDALRPTAAAAGSAGSGAPSCRVLALGIGPLSSAASRCQLALGLILTEQLGACLSAYDPAFGPADTAVLVARGCAVLPSAAAASAAHSAAAAEEGGPAFSLLFMPHCEAELYEAVLEANWSAAALRRMAVLGNRFSGYADRWSTADPSQPHRNLRRRPVRVIAVSGHCAEHKVDPGAFAVASAFNDMSLHSFGSVSEEVLRSFVVAATCDQEMEGEAAAAARRKEDQGSGSSTNKQQCC